MTLMLKMEAKKLYTPDTHKRSSTLVQELCFGAMLVAKVHQPGVLDVIIAYTYMTSTKIIAVVENFL